MQVNINGQVYIPQGTQSSVKIGVAISTQNRNESINSIVHKWKTLMPEGAVLIVVDDCSTTPVVLEDESVLLYKNTEVLGIAGTKNRCLELLEKEGVVEFFLVDDDCYPLTADWWQPYVQSKEPHLMYMFKDVSKGQKLNDISIIDETAELIAYTSPRGVLLYCNNSVLETVGGMDTIYGRWGYEHVDWSNRIFNAGLTSYRFADVKGSENLIHSMDEHLEINRTVSTQERQELSRKNAQICNDRKRNGYKAYKEYRTLKNVVMTNLYTGKPDPQRPTQHMDTTLTDKLFTSLKKYTGFETIYFTDTEEQALNIPGEIIINNLTDLIFFQRHLNAYQYLRENKDIQFAWCVDATDVELLKEPFEFMKPGKLYTGWENKTQSDSWMTSNRHTSAYQEWVKQNPSLPLLNAGVFGGDRQTMMSFLHQLISYWQDSKHDVWVQKQSVLDLGDMAAFNYVAYSGGFDIITGPPVTTLFKGEEANNTHSVWKHK